jgi:hypothetical protein
VLLLRFDNKHSWSRSKTVTLYVETIARPRPKPPPPAAPAAPEVGLGSHRRFVPPVILFTPDPLR